MELVNYYIEKISNYRDIIFSVAIIFILSILLLPVSSLVIDFLFSLSITFSTMILMTVLAILTIINFIVITRGSGRIAEVSARFSLDAMPGKQMAIDSDLASGAITDKEARERRKEVEAESTFFGAMDGAGKFVRGDAIAGILIIFINFIAGMIIGVLQRDMGSDKALHTYTILTIGDGLISQIPALVISVSAGLLVTKSSSGGSTDQAIMEQLSKYPRAMMVTAAFLLATSCVPDMPTIAFAFLGIITGGHILFHL